MNPQTINLLGKAGNIDTLARELSREVDRWNEMHDEPLTEAEMKEFTQIMSSIELNISSSVREMHDRNAEKVKAITKASE